MPDSIDDFKAVASPRMDLDNSEENQIDSVYTGITAKQYRDVFVKPTLKVIQIVCLFGNYFLE